MVCFSFYFICHAMLRQCYGVNERATSNANKSSELELRSLFNMWSGDATDVLYNASVYFDGKGSLAGVFAAARDVTERKRLFLSLQERNVELQHATSVAEKANLAKSEFLSRMSHELRTPLNAILGFAQLLAITTPPPTRKQTESLKQIVRAGWYLLELINEILDLAII